MKIKIFSAALLVSLLLSSCGMLKKVEKDTEPVTSDQVSRTETVYTGLDTTVAETGADTESSVSETTAEITTEAPTEVPETTSPPPETTTTVTTLTETVTTAAPPVTESDTPDTSPTENGLTSKGYTVTAVDGITYVDGILIANKTYGLPETYNPGGLTPETYAAFVEMQAAASAAGHYIYVRSGYRSYIDQRIIYADYANRDGTDAADRYSARAGHSEHQSGMAIDVNETSYAFGESPAGIWLRENCHKYGFILRYPQDKEPITGYMYEPWHIRFVGVELAEKIHATGLTLEEYFGITSTYAE